MPVTAPAGMPISSPGRLSHRDISTVLGGTAAWKPPLHVGLFLRLHGNDGRLSCNAFTSAAWARAFTCLPPQKPRGPAATLRLENRFRVSSSVKPINGAKARFLSPLSHSLLGKPIHHLPPECL